MKIKKEGRVIFESGKIIEIKNFEVEYDNNDKEYNVLLEEYVKSHYIKIENNTNITTKNEYEKIRKRMKT
jgi:hypothetical protein